MLQSRTDPGVDRMEGWWRGLFIIIIQRHYLCSSTIKLIGLWKEHREAAALVLNVNSSAKDMCYFLRWHTGTTKLCNNYHQQDQPASRRSEKSLDCYVGWWTTSQDLKIELWWGIELYRNLQTVRLSAAVGSFLECQVMYLLMYLYKVSLFATCIWTYWSVDGWIQDLVLSCHI